MVLVSECDYMLNPDLLVTVVIVSMVLLCVVIWQLQRLARQMLALALRQEEARKRQVELAERWQDTQQQSVAAQLRAVADLQAHLEKRFGDMQQSIEKRLGETSATSVESMRRFGDDMKADLQAQKDALQTFRSDFEKRFGEMHNGIEKRLGDMTQQSMERFAQANKQLQDVLHQRLTEMSGIVEKRLEKGFEKTTETFADVLKRLALIDEAQKRITELSGNVVSLQEVLTDKRSRGAFGEVQMAALIRNVLPEGSYALQHTLSNGTRVDCMMFLPEPTGNVAIDSKFPLDSFQKMMDNEAGESVRAQAERQFRKDIRKHIDDIAGKYIIADETADGAIMFIPAEAVFAEIHAHQPALVEAAQRARVWMVSPTTLMAVLTTARAVLKDSATRKQVHIIKEHLVSLGKDFERFRKRMDNLSKHIQQAGRDVEEVHISASKISSRFEKIENVEIPREESALPDESSE